MRLIMLGSSSDYGLEVVDLLETCPDYELVGVLDASLPVGAELFGYRVLGSEDDLRSYFDANLFDGGVIAVCENWLRSKLVDRVKHIFPGLLFPPLVHPTVQIGKAAAIGAGSVICEGVVINSDARVGQFCVLRQNSSLGHEAVMSDFASLSQEVATGGNVRIGRCAAVARNSVLIHGISIGERSTIEEDAVVVRDVPPEVVAGGNPARVKVVENIAACRVREACS